MKQPTLIICYSNNDGGMELNSMDIALLLQPLGPIYYSCRKNSFIEKKLNRLEHAGITTLTIDFRGNLSIHCILKLRDFIRKHSIRNIIFFGASELKSIVPATWGLNINIINFHGTTKTHNKNDFLHKFIYKHVQHHVAVSKHIKKNALSVLPVRSQQVTVIGLPHEITHPKTKTRNEKISFIHIGRIAEGKGHLDSLKVIEFLIQNNINCSLSFVGSIVDPVLHQKLVNTIKSSKHLDKAIFFTGFSDAIHELLSNADIMLFPSQGEGLPNVIIESFLSKTLPITYNNTVFPEFLEMGFDFPQIKTNDIASLKKEALNLIELDNKEFERKIINNYNLAKELFSSEIIRNKYKNLLK